MGGWAGGWDVPCFFWCVYWDETVAEDLGGWVGGLNELT